MRPIYIRTCLFVLLIFGTLPLHVQGQNSWDLESCIAHAQEQNILIKRQALQAKSVSSQLQMAQAARLPSLSGWASHNLSSGKTVNFEDYSYINTEYQDGNTGIQGDWTVFSGLNIHHAIRQQKFALEAALHGSESLKNSTAIQVTGAYLQVLFAMELLEVAKQQAKVSQEQVNSTEIFVELGRMARANLLEMKAQMARDALSLVTAENNFNSAKLGLAHLMNLTEIEGFSIVIPEEVNLTQILVADHKEVYSSAVRTLPRIKQAEMTARSFEAALAMARSSMVPRISLSGMYYSRYSELGVNPLDPKGLYPYSAQLKDNSYGRVSINLNIPIFNGLRTKNQITQAKISSLDSKLALDQEKISLQMEIQKAFADAQNARLKYESSQNALASTAESFDYTQERYKAGLATGIDLNISQSQLILSKSTLLQAKYEFLLKSKILDFYNGEAIRL